MACTTGGFWQTFSSNINVLCLSEAKHALMAHSLVGVPGAITLLCNLSTTVDFGLDTAQVEHVSGKGLLHTNCPKPTQRRHGGLVSACNTQHCGCMHGHLLQ